MTPATKLETVIDLDVLGLVLESFFARWKGSYYVMPVDAPDRPLLQHPNRSAPLCRKIRSTQEGDRLCRQHDLRLSEEAFSREQPITTLCHAGMLGFVIPILADDEPLATIFFGQGRSWLKEQEKEGKKRLVKTANNLGLGRWTPLILRRYSPRYSEQQFNDIKAKLTRIATYVSELGHEKTEAEAMKRALEMQLYETEAVRRVVTKVVKVVDDLSIFWEKVDDALTEICGIIGAKYGVFVTYEAQSDGSRMPTVQAVGNLERRSFIGKIYPQNDPLFRQIIEEAVTAQPPWRKVAFHEHSEQGTICYDIRVHCSANTLPDEAVLLPIDLGGNTQGILIFLLDKRGDVENSLVIEREMEIIVQVAPQISLAYQNCVLSSERRSLTVLRRDWLENMAHQLVAPLTGIEGHAERFFHRFWKWLGEDQKLIDSTLETLLSCSKMTARLARNFAWIAADRSDSGYLNPVRETDLVGQLIIHARNIQGLAAERRLRRVHVDEKLMKLLNGRVALDRRLFGQAVANLLDNAVKYADKGTEVLVRGEIDDAQQRAYIHITNTGIPITDDQVDKIFDREYRTLAAIRKCAIGTGIGLTIARDIVRLHSGNLTVKPSCPVDGSFRTTFTIDLPLLKQATEPK